MPRNIAAQQQYIDRLQEELNSAKEDRHSLIRLWSDATARDKYEGVSLIGYEIGLDYGSVRVWGFDENEHLAWKKAYKALENEGVLSAFRKMDETPTEATDE